MHRKCMFFIANIYVIYILSIKNTHIVNVYMLIIYIILSQALIYYTTFSFILNSVLQSFYLCVIRTRYRHGYYLLFISEIFHF